MGAKGSKISSKEMEKIFDQFDADGSGAIDRLEIAKYMREHYPHIPLGIVDLFIYLADEDRSGEIDKNEFDTFYKIVQSTVSTDLTLPELMFNAASVAEKSKNISATTMVGILKCFGIFMSVDEIARKYGKSLDRETFIKLVTDQGLD